MTRNPTEWFTAARLFQMIHETTWYQGELTKGHMTAWLDRRMVKRGAVDKRKRGRTSEYRAAQLSISENVFAQTNAGSVSAEAATKVNHRISWCGPVAMTVITGRSYRECEAAIVDHRARNGLVAKQRRRGVGGTWVGEIAAVIGQLGGAFHETKNYTQWSRTWSDRRGRYINKRKRPTLNQWFAQNTDGTTAWNEFVLLNVGHPQGNRHWIIVHRGLVYDVASPTGRNAKGRPLYGCGYERCTVETASWFTRTGGVR